MAAARTGTDYVSSHVLRFFARLICTVNSWVTGETTRCKKKGGGGVVAPHSADTENSHRQLPYLPVQAQIYVIFFSTSTRVMEKNYFHNTFNYWF
jgi:hypothetical protein